MANKRQNATGWKQRGDENLRTDLLVVNDSSVLKGGPSSIVTQSPFVTRAHGLSPGNAERLEIQFFTKPTTEAAMTDMLKNGAKELRKSDYAALVFG